MIKISTSNCEYKVNGKVMTCKQAHEEKHRHPDSVIEIIGEPEVTEIAEPEPEEKENLFP